MYYNRIIEKEIENSLTTFAVTALLGPRQCGKSTLAKHIISKIENTIYLDLERPSDLNKLNDAEWFLSSNKGKLFCIDEIQRKPELFPLIRSLVDDWGGKGHFLILGSASRDLLKQSSETLAGRISYHRLTPFTLPEIDAHHSFEDYFIKGGFPGSLLSKTMNESFLWRENFITTFIERDLLQWAGITPQLMRRLWQMLAHVNGQVVNYSVLANSLGVSSPTVRNYIDLLTSTYMLETVQPYLVNAGKRIVKSPKIYVSDPGLINSFTGVLSYNQLLGHISLGALWETIVLLHLKAYFPFISVYFYRTSQGAEIDFVLEYGSKVLAVECKATLSPSINKGNYISFTDVKADKLLIVIPAEKGWEKNKDTLVVTIPEALTFIQQHFFGSTK
ncbi:MAG: ATP-binding protein [Bacteroidales bacterium]|jgi:predicted AAA+ superfamily ATPase|nr:ATP-binding protein [Bacteroidales bacterium]